MIKKTVLILLTLIALTSVSAQKSLNDYKYIIVPNKFEFLKEADEHRLNSLTKFLFEKYNFDVLMEDEIFPSDYSNNNCLGLKADVLKDSNLFKTKLYVQLKNCKNEIIFTSAEGESREKNFKTAYNLALRNAFKSIEDANYSYNFENVMTSNSEIEVVEENQEEIKKLKEEIKVLKETKKEEVVVNKQETVLTKTEEKPVVKTNINTSVSNNTLTAIIISGSVFSYHLLNDVGEKRYTILFSGKTDLYIVKDLDAVIYKLNNLWVIAEVKEDGLQVKSLDIKF